MIFVILLTLGKTLNINKAQYLIKFHFSLIKEEMNRPKYKTLLQHPFIKLHETRLPCDQPEIAAYISNVVESMANNGITQFTTDVNNDEIW